jgi:hypothetical protein
MVDRITKALVRMVAITEKLSDVLADCSKRGYELRISPISEEELALLPEKDCCMLFVQLFDQYSDKLDNPFPVFIQKYTEFEAIVTKIKEKLTK